MSTSSTRSSPKTPNDSGDEIISNILLVDDRAENLFALEAILTPMGQNLIKAQSGVEALRHLLVHDFAVILLDVQMPGLDGFELASIIKERERTRYTPIIFVTAISTDARYIGRGYSAGAVDYLPKPFNPDILLSKVSVFIDLWKKTEQIKRQADLLRQTEQHELELENARRERDLERRHTKELAESEARLLHFKSTLDLTVDAVSIFDPESLQFLYVNKGAQNQLGYGEDELMAMRAFEVKPQVDEALFRALIAPLRDSTKKRTKSHTFETVHCRKDGTHVPVEAVLQFIELDGHGRFISIVRDITERKRAETLMVQARQDAERARDEAEVARDEAEAANRAKSEFLSSVSHELRTPLNAIIGFSKLLLNPRVGALNEDQNEYTKDIVQGAEHLLQLINDILDLAKIEAGKVDISPSTFGLVETVEQSLSIVREKARSHNLQLATDFEDRVLDVELFADLRRFKQVMYNLLSNAVKFTPDGGTVTVGARLDEAHPDETPSVLVWVRDTGIGIPLEFQSRIFGAFEQVDSSYTRQQQGTGLGLALTRRIVSLHGGELWVESDPEQGSTFTFRLPLDVREQRKEMERALIEELQPTPKGQP